VAIKGDTIAKVGDLGDARGKTERDVHGQVIAPGFINMMSSEWGLFADGRSQSDMRQGGTLEIFGEGESMGPLNDMMRTEYEKQEIDIHYDVTWRTLAEGPDALARRGVSTNIASFWGAATPRLYVLGRANWAPTATELDQMRLDHRKGDGRRHPGSDFSFDLPAWDVRSYRRTDSLAKVAASYHGIYISHIPNEGEPRWRPSTS
jgi:N-acyl-D-amino-acid deacylase